MNINEIIWTGHAHSTIAIKKMVNEEVELIGMVGNYKLKLKCIGGFILANVGDTIYYDGIDPIIQHNNH